MIQHPYLEVELKHCLWLFVMLMSDAPFHNLPLNPFILPHWPWWGSNWKSHYFRELLFQNVSLPHLEGIISLEESLAYTAWTQMCSSQALCNMAITKYVWFLLLFLTHLILTQLSPRITSMSHNNNLWSNSKFNRLQFLEFAYIICIIKTNLCLPIWIAEQTRTSHKWPGANDISI